MSPSELITQLVADLDIRSVDPSWEDAASDLHQKLTKPPGSLGQLESVGTRLAAIARTERPPLPEPATVVIFAGDHGVVAEGVTPWPQDVTAQMVENFCGGGAAINAIARSNGLDVLVVNVGVARTLPDHDRLINGPIGSGTANLRTEPAMSTNAALAAIRIGIDVARNLVDEGNACLVTGDMGIGNTTPSTALIAKITSSEVATITGRGAGIDDHMLENKIRVIEDALSRCEAVSPQDTLSVLAELGGYEIGGLAGLCLGAAAQGVPVVVDGVIALAGALVAAGIEPACVDYMIAGHRSVEPAASAALAHLGLEPLIDLDLRLGEGSGAALAYPLVKASAAVLSQMSTFESAGVSSADE